MAPSMYMYMPVCMCYGLCCVLSVMCSLFVASNCRHMDGLLSSLERMRKSAAQCQSLTGDALRSDAALLLCF